jgi:hypothetical protein
MERFSVSRNPQLLAVSKIPKPEHGTEEYVWAGRPVNPGFDTLEGTREICHGNFSLKGKIPSATMVWVV